MGTIVKICGITNLRDALAAVEAGADALGFIFYPDSPRYVPLPVAQAISQKLPESIIRVGVFVDPQPDEVFSISANCGLGLLQFHGNESPEFCRQFGIMAMKAFRIRDTDSLAPIQQYNTDAFLLDSYVPGKAGGTGEVFNWSLAVEAKKFGKPIVLAGGLTPSNVADAVRAVRPFGVDVSSGVEIAPGKKDAVKMRDFVAAVRAVGDLEAENV
jgi:phosphoribosylanthranilate isomerase